MGCREGLEFHSPAVELKKVVGLENHVVELEEGERILPGETELNRFERHHAIDGKERAIVPDFEVQGSRFRVVGACRCPWLRIEGFGSRVWSRSVATCSAFDKFGRPDSIRNPKPYTLSHRVPYMTPGRPGSRACLVK